jgi:hypothetical protein
LFVCVRSQCVAKFWSFSAALWQHTPSQPISMYIALSLIDLICCYCCCCYNCLAAAMLTLLIHNQPSSQMLDDNLNCTDSAYITSKQHELNNSLYMRHRGKKCTHVPSICSARSLYCWQSCVLAYASFSIAKLIKHCLRCFRICPQALVTKSAFTSAIAACAALVVHIDPLLCHDQR